MTQAYSNLIAVGNTGLIYAVDDGYALKLRPQSSDPFIHQAFSVELRVYERLGNHPRIAKVKETTEKSIVLERGECLRRKIQNAQKRESESIPLRTKLQWARDAAEGLRYIHDRGIIQGDVGCHNLLLDRLGSEGKEGGHIKFIDFAGSGIDDEPALVGYEWCSFRPDPAQPGAVATIKTDIFAFGSTLFEIESGNVPFHELQATLDIYPLMRRAEELFGLRQYPELGGLLLGEVIRGCWDGRYERMEEVTGDIMGCQGGVIR